MYKIRQLSLQITFVCPMEKELKQTQTTTWLTLAVAAIALVMSILAYNRAGQDISSVLAEETMEGVENIQQMTAVAQAQVELAAIRTRILAGEAGEELAQEVAQTRRNLAQAYENASEEARQEWQELDAELEQLEQQVRDGSADTIGTVNNALQTTRQDLQSNPDAAEDLTPPPAEGDSMQQ